MQAIAHRDPQDSRPVVIMAQDEGRFGRISDPRPCWAPKGIRPAVPKQIVRQYLYVYAAVCPELGKMTALLLPYANTEMMNIFLEEVSRDFGDYFVVMLVDQAAWHLSKDLRIPDNIRFIAQPAHSPELNPTEHLWDEIREKGIPNLAFVSMDELETAVCDELVNLGADPKRLRSLTDFPYLQVHC